VECEGSGRGDGVAAGRAVVAQLEQQTRRGVRAGGQGLGCSVHPLRKRGYF